MLFIDRNGLVDAEKVKLKIFPLIENRPMGTVNGIVVHQTGGSTADGAYSSYSKLQPNGKRPNGAHFMIEKDGTIYQTASLHKTTNHVGDLQSRCLLKKKCSNVDLQAARKLDQTKSNRARADATNKVEFAKPFPDRFPYNADSIGIEIVGAPTRESNEEIYERVNAAQNASLQWLVKELAETLNVSMQEIYRHPEIGRKNLTEASTAKW